MGPSDAVITKFNMLLCGGANSLSTGILLHCLIPPMILGSPLSPLEVCFTTLQTYQQLTKKLLMRTSNFQVSSPNIYAQSMLNKMWHEPSWKHIRKHVLPKAKLCLICWDFLCTNVESFVQRMIYPLNHFLPESEQIDRISPCPHIPIKSTQLPWWPTWYLPKKNCT